MSEGKELGFTCYQVGKPYDKIMHCDGAVFEIHENLCMCSLGLTDVSAAKVLSVERGKLRLSLTT